MVTKSCHVSKQRLAISLSFLHPNLNTSCNQCYTKSMMWIPPNILQPRSRFMKVAPLIEVLGVANRIILKWHHRFGSTQGLALPHEPSKNFPPPAHPLAGTSVAVVDSWVLELIDWQARRHHASRNIRGSLHRHCEILFHLCGVWHLFFFFLLRWICNVLCMYAASLS